MPVSNHDEDVPSQRRRMVEEPLELFGRQHPVPLVAAGLEKLLDLLEDLCCGHAHLVVVEARLTTVRAAVISWSM